MSYEPCDHHIQAEKLGRLKPNWDSYGGDPPTEKALGAALGALRAGCLVPRSDGGVTLELRADEYEVELSWDSTGALVSGLAAWDRAKGEACAHQ